MTPEPAAICLGCWQNLHVPIPLRGPLSTPFRLFGIKPSRMNPNTCTICEMAFSKVMKARAVTIDATVLFADLRGYTTLTQSIGQAGLTSLLDAFYDDCATAIWRHDGLLNKTIGDAVFAIFNFPVKRENHAVEALTKSMRAELAPHGITVNGVAPTVVRGEMARRNPFQTEAPTRAEKRWKKLGSAEPSSLRADSRSYAEMMAVRSFGRSPSDERMNRLSPKRAFSATSMPGASLRASSGLM